MTAESRTIPIDQSRPRIPVWGAIQDFKGLLDSGTPIAHALPAFARDCIVPLLKGVTTYEQFADSTDAFRTQMSHAVRNSQNHPRLAADSYPGRVIERVEDIFLDTQLYPRISPDGEGEFQEAPIDVSGFPQLIAERMRITPAGRNRILKGTPLMGNSGVDTKTFIDELEGSARRYNDESDRENAQRNGIIYSGMDRIAQDFMDSLQGIRSSRGYRTQMSLLHDSLHETTVAYNDSLRHTNQFSSRDGVRPDESSHWEEYVAGKVREGYFTLLFKKAFQ